jgi:hypothetical protein
MYYDSVNGRIGLGTTAPTYRFQVSDGTTPVFSADSTTGYVKVGKTLAITPYEALDIGGHLNFNMVEDPTSAQVTGMTLTNAGAGSIPAGTYYYGVQFYTIDGDTGALIYATAPIITLAGSSKVDIANIPTSTDPRVIGRKIYRSQAGTVGDFYYRYRIATIADNTTTTYQDNTTTYDSSDWEYNKQNTTAGIIYTNAGTGSLAKAMQITSYVTAVGRGALGSLTRGSTSAAFGSSALTNVTTGDNNNAFGHSAGSQVTTGLNNNYFGYASGQGNQTGGSNSAFGSNALRNSTTSSTSHNVAFGAESLNGLTINNNYNVAVGSYAGTNSQAYGGTYIGAWAGRQSSATTIGNYNLVLGHEAGRALGTGARNVLIGYQVELATPNTSDQLNIGNVIYAKGLGTGSSASATGGVGIGVVPASITARLHLPAGTASAGTAPLKLTSGTNLTTPEAGAIEFDGTNLYFTDSGGTRRQLAVV